MTIGLTIGAVGTVLGLIVGTILLYFRQGAVTAVQVMSGTNPWDPSVRILTELPSKTDPIEVIKWKEFLEILENATDRAESVANIIESIVLKHN